MLLLGILWDREGIVTGDVEILRDRDDEVRDRGGIVRTPSRCRLATYQKHGLVQVRFPSNSGDLNPIETVWARLRKDLALREQEDLAARRTISVAQFRQRAAQIRNSYGCAAPGESHSYLRKLVSGMPRRLARCKANKHGRCGE